MSMISEQVKELRELADGYKMADRPLAANTIYQAADTIEALSAKLQEANMDNDGGWITVDENNLPKGEVLGCNGKGGMAVGKIKKVKDGDVRVVDFLGGGLMNCVAYMLLPEPYRP